jgi:hypothetical protein
MEPLELMTILHTQEVRGSSPCAPTNPTVQNQLTLYLPFDKA